jgi:hypothetical protein
MSAICLMLGLLMVAGGAEKPMPSFTGDIRLPLDLYTAEGAHLEKGRYTVEVKTENGQYRLVFLQDDQARATVKGEDLPADDGAESGFPLIGAQYLRSSDDPVGTEAERHFSKTGLPQYEEENRDWKATLRAYTAGDQEQTLWLFEEREPGRKWLHVHFTVYLHPR